MGTSTRTISATDAAPTTPIGSAPIYLDAVGTAHRRAAPGARIACLVPSITELVCELGLAAQLVARTGFCVHPREVVAGIPKVGGTKDVDLVRLRELAPTHVIVNIDENLKPAVEAIARFVPHVIVTHPNAPQDNLALYQLLGGIFAREAVAARLADALRAALGATLDATAALPRENVLYLIWKNPWMTVARDTYISRTLAVVGWDTVPAVCTSRYPAIDLLEAARAASLVLLSSEPYMFRAPHVAQLEAELAASPSGAPQWRGELAAAAGIERVMLIDGEMTSWYGSRAISGLSYLAALRLDCYNRASQRA